MTDKYITIPGPSPASPGGVTRCLHALCKPDILREYAFRFHLTTFVETGTHYGETTVRMMLAPPIDRAYTIELDPVYGNRFQGDNRVTTLLGSSIEELPKVIALLKGPALFWLDAHAGDISDLNPRHFPLRQELEIIFGAENITGSVVLVDDARFIGYGHYPTLREVRAIARGHKVEMIDDILRIEP